jgi:hypothetical protein
MRDRAVGAAIDKGLQDLPLMAGESCQFLLKVGPLCIATVICLSAEREPHCAEQDLGVVGLLNKIYGPKVSAFSEHEHIPEIAASALADYLLKQAHGSETIRTIIIEDIHKALDEDRLSHAAELFMALRHFLETHPDGRVGTSGGSVQRSAQAVQ